MYVPLVLIQTFCPCDLVASTFERVPLTPHSTGLATVTREPNAIVVVVAKLPTIFVTLHNVPPHISLVSLDNKQ